MSEIVISEFMDAAAVSDLTAAYTVRHDVDLWKNPDVLKQTLRDAQALIVRNRTQVDREVIEAAPSLRAVGRLGVGLDNIDLDACAEHGIAVLPATGANADSVAEYVVATALMLLRNGAYFANETMITGEWPREKLIGGELAGRVLGLLGYGSIGQVVAAKAAALGMTVIAFDPALPNGHEAWNNATSVTFASVIESSDVVSLHLPLVDDTRRLVDADVMAQMKPDAVLINSARGGIVDEAALCEALKTKAIAGAALDVFEQEPLDAQAGAKFSNVPNLILTPHIAGVTHDANRRVSHVTAQNVVRVLKERS